MTSFKTARELSLLCYKEGFLSDEEFCLLYGENKSKILDLPYDSFKEFQLDLLEEKGCKAEFRFDKRDIDLLANALQLPDVFNFALFRSIEALTFSDSGSVLGIASIASLFACLSRFLFRCYPPHRNIHSTTILVSRRTVHM